MSSPFREEEVNFLITCICGVRRTLNKPCPECKLYNKYFEPQSLNTLRRVELAKALQDPHTVREELAALLKDAVEADHLDDLHLRWLALVAPLARMIGMSSRCEEDLRAVEEKVLLVPPDYRCPVPYRGDVPPKE